MQIQRFIFLSITIAAMQVNGQVFTNKEVGNKIIFLRKLARGGSTHSFGIHVAKMAGMPPSLIERANDILKQLETKHVGENSEESGVRSQESECGDRPTS